MAKVEDVKFKAGQTVFVEVVFTDKPDQISYEQHKVQIHRGFAYVSLFGSGDSHGFGPFDTVTGELIGKGIPSIRSIKLLLEKPARCKLFE